MNVQKILVVDDEEDICEILKFNLELHGFCVDLAHSAEDALTFDLCVYNLILLDVMMGDMSGFKFASILQNNINTRSIPIIFITARDTENDLLTGFNLGADDYISKPFSIKEVLVRVKAVLRRVIPVSCSSIVSYEGISLDIDTKRITIDGKDVQFTKTEFDLLHLFLSNKNIFFTRDEILSKVWKGDVCVLDRTVDVNIARVRKKIGCYSKFLISKAGFGYSFKC